VLSCSLCNFILFTVSLVAILGRSVNRPDTINGWNSLVRDQAERFQNFPRNSKGKKLELKDFQQMPTEELGVWRDHLVDSFTEGSGCKHPFQVVDKDGKVPILNVLRMGPKDEDKKSTKEKTAGSRSKGSKLDKDTTVSKRGRKRKSKATVDDSDDSGDTCSGKDSDGGAAAKPVLSSEVNESPRKHLVRRPAPRPAPRPTSNPTNYSDATLSYYLQTNSMEGTTLPVDWKRVGFNADKVSNVLYTIVCFILHYGNFKHTIVCATLHIYY
jgi:hypothetical protein